MFSYGWFIHRGGLATQHQLSINLIVKRYADLRLLPEKAQ